VIARPIVFAFSAQLGNRVRDVCETIGMEVAHAYGLDHGYLCSDVMTYLQPCGAKRFVDKDIRCGRPSRATARAVSRRRTRIAGCSRCSGPGGRPARELESLKSRAALGRP